MDAGRALDLGVEAVGLFFGGVTRLQVIRDHRVVAGGVRVGSGGQALAEREVGPAGNVGAGEV